MSGRRFFLGQDARFPELEALLEAELSKCVTDEQLAEQRISFAYGNALDEDGITKQSVREATKRVRLISA
jgi:hypothetical protein